MYVEAPRCADSQFSSSACKLKNFNPTSYKLKAPEFAELGTISGQELINWKYGGEAGTPERKLDGLVSESVELTCNCTRFVKITGYWSVHDMDIRDIQQSKKWLCYMNLRMSVK